MIEFITELNNASHDYSISTDDRECFEDGANWALTSSLVRELVMCAQELHFCTQALSKHPEWKALGEALERYNAVVKELEGK